MLKPGPLRLLSVLAWAVVLDLVRVCLSTTLPTLWREVDAYSSFVSLNEFLPCPQSEYTTEWIELYNGSSETVDLSGWKLDHAAGGGEPYVFPEGTTIGSYGFLLCFQSQTGLILDNADDCVHLLDPDGQEVESHCYTSPPPDGSRSKIVDGGNLWTWSYPPSPGRSNRPATPTPSPTAMPTSTPSATPSLPPSVTPGPTWTVTTSPTAAAEHTPSPPTTPSVLPSVTPGPTATMTASPTATAEQTPPPSATPTPISRSLFLNEVLPAARYVDWDGDGHPDFNDEWIELFNAGEVSVDLGGWQLDDRAGEGARPYTIPSGTIIPSQGFVVFFKVETWVGLNDHGDEVRLLRPDGSIADAIEYEMHPGYDQSFSRTVDGGGEWVDDWAVTPGEANRAREKEWGVRVPLLMKSFVPT